MLETVAYGSSGPHEPFYTACGGNTRYEGPGDPIFIPENRVAGKASSLKDADRATQPPAFYLILTINCMGECRVCRHRLGVAGTTRDVVIMTTIRIIRITGHYLVPVANQE